MNGLQGYIPYSFSENIMFDPNGIAYIGSNFSKQCVSANCINNPNATIYVAGINNGRMELKGYHGNVSTPLTGPAWVCAVGIICYK